MSELKPCPFCGSKAEYNNDDNGNCWIECGGCGAMSGYCHIPASEDVYDLWNRRTENARLSDGEHSLYGRAHDEIVRLTAERDAAMKALKNETRQCNKHQQRVIDIGAERDAYREALRDLWNEPPNWNFGDADEAWLGHHPQHRTTIEKATGGDGE